MKGCDGTGHILGIFSTHRSLSGCPLSVRIAELQQNSDTKVCPTPGCDGTGNTKSMYAFHRSVQRCPLMREKLEEYKGALTVKQVEDMLLRRIPFPLPNGLVGPKLQNGGLPGKKSPSQMDTSSRANGKGATVADKNGENKSPKTATGLSSSNGDSRKGKSIRFGYLVEHPSNRFSFSFVWHQQLARRAAKVALPVVERVSPL